MPSNALKDVGGFFSDIGHELGVFATKTLPHSVGGVYSDVKHAIGGFEHDIVGLVKGAEGTVSGLGKNVEGISGNLALPLALAGGVALIIFMNQSK